MLMLAVTREGEIHGAQSNVWSINGRLFVCFRMPMVNSKRGQGIARRKREHLGKPTGPEGQNASLAV